MRVVKDEDGNANNCGDGRDDSENNDVTNYVIAIVTGTYE